MYLHVDIWPILRNWKPTSAAVGWFNSCLKANILLGSTGNFAGSSEQFSDRSGAVSGDHARRPTARRQTLTPFRWKLLKKIRQWKLVFVVSMQTCISELRELNRNSDQGGQEQRCNGDSCSRAQVTSKVLNIFTKRLFSCLLLLTSGAYDAAIAFVRYG